MADLRAQMGPPPPAMLMGPVIPGRLGGLRLPRIEVPRPQPDGSTPTIKGLSGDEHHDRIRMAVRRLEGTLHREQVSMVHDVEHNAESVRRQLAALALQVPGVVRHYQNAITRSVNSAVHQIRLGLRPLQDTVRDAPVDLVQIEAAREAARQQILSTIQSHQDNNVQEVRSRLDEALGTYGPQLNGKLAGILNGIQPSTFETVPAEGDPAPTGSGPTLSQAQDESLLVSEGAARAPSAWIAGDDPEREWLSVYADLWRCAFFCDRVTPGLHDSAASQIQTAAENARTSGTQDVFISLLGLVAPSLPSGPDVEQQARQPASPNHEDLPVDPQERADEQHRRQVVAAKRQTHDGLQQKADDAIAFLEQEIRDKQVEILRITGERLQRQYYQKAEQIHRELANHADPLADRYREIAASTGELLDTDQQMDSTEVLPQLEEIETQAMETRPHELEPLEAFGRQSVEQSEESWTKQIRSFAKMLDDTNTRLSDYEAVIDLDLQRLAAPFLMASGNSSRADVLSISGRVPDIARQNAEQLLEREDERRQANATGPILAALLGSFNATLVGAVEGQRDFVAAIATLDDRYFSSVNQALRTNIYESVKTDVAGRRQRLERALLPWSARTSSSEVYSALAVSWPGPKAIEEDFNLNFADGYGALHGDYRPSLVSSARNLNPTDLQSAMGYLPDGKRGNALALLSSSAETRGFAKADIAADAVNSPLMASDDYQVLLSLSDQERQALRDGGHWSGIEQRLQASSWRNESQSAMALLNGRVEVALAWELRDDISSARNTHDTQRIESAARRFDGVVNRFIAESEHNMGMLGRGGQILLPSEEGAPTPATLMRQQATLELARILTREATPNANVDDMTPEQAATVVARWATRPTTKQETDWVQVGAGVLLGALSLGLGAAVVVDAVNKDVTVDHSGARSTVAADLLHGGESDEAYEERVRWASTEVDRADGDYTTATAIQVDSALQDQQLISARYNVERLQRQIDELPDGSPERRGLEEQLVRARERLVEARRTHVARVDIAARASGWDPDSNVSAENFLVQRYGRVFDEIDDDWGSTYARELVTRGRGSLETATEMSTEGWGTNDSFLEYSWQGRSKGEIATARSYWLREHDETLDSFLGINRSSQDRLLDTLAWLNPITLAASMVFGPETSGDLAMGLEIASIGIPENDQDLAKIAALRYQQQRVRGTGWLAKLFLDDCDEAQRMDTAQEQLAIELRLAAGLGPGEPVFNANGEILPEVAAAAFDESGNLNSGPAAIQLAAKEMEDASTAYQKRLADFESKITLGISIIVAIIVVIITVILMFFGVGFVLAGIIAGVAGAILGGAATIAAKSGVRGERYGYEEMAVDLAVTAVEAVTAVVTGGLMKGLGPAVGAGARVGVGAAARTGAGVAGRAAAQAGGRAAAGAGARAGIGRVGQMMLIQAGGGAVNGAAQVAFQDATWEEGFGKGMQRVLGNAAKMAAVSAITAGAGEGASMRMGAAFRNMATAGPRTLGPLGKVGSAMSQRTAYMVSETVGDMAGGLAGETFAIGVEAADGTLQGDVGDILMRLGASGLRDAIGGAGRAGTQTLARRRVAGLTTALRNRGDITPSEYHSLARRSRAAGVELGSYDQVRAHIVQGRALLDALPPMFRERASGMELEQLKAFGRYLKGEPIGDALAQRQFLYQIAEVLPGFDPIRTFEQAEAHISAQQKVRERHHEMRSHLAAGLPERVRGAMGDVPVRVLEALPEAELHRLASSVARGEISAEELSRVTTIATQNRPGLDVASFRAAVRRVVEAGRQANQMEVALLVEQRRTVLSDIPQAEHAVFARLPAGPTDDVATLMQTGHRGSPQLRESLFHQARQVDPAVTRQRFFTALDAGIDAATARRDTQQRAARAARYDLLGDLPDATRTQLSALPPGGLLELRLLQASGQPLTAGRRAALVDAARRASPGVDPQRLSDALDAALAEGLSSNRPQASEAHREALRSGLPESMKPLADDAALLVLRPDEFLAYTGTENRSAHTMMVDGKPVVVVRSDADPSVLRQEGMHAAAALQPRFLPDPAGPDASQRRQWNELSLTEQLSLQRNKLQEDVTLQRLTVEELEASILKNGGDPALSQSVLEARRTLTALENRLAEIDIGDPAVRQAPATSDAQAPAPFRAPGPVADGADPQAVRRRVEQSTGVDKGPAHRNAQRLLEQQALTHMAEATKPITVKGKKVEQFVDKNGKLMFNKDGTPRGYEIEYAYDVRHFSHGLTHITIKVHLDPEAGVTPAEIAQVKANAQAGMDQFYNGGQHQIPGPDGRPNQLHVEIKFVDNKADAHLSVDLRKGNGQAYQNLWFVDAHPAVHAHELSHQLGRVDEYKDHAPYGHAAANRATATSPGVRTDGGLMGNFWLKDRRSLLTKLVHRLRGIKHQAQVDPRTHVPKRYIDEMAADIHAARGGDTPFQKQLQKNLGMDNHLTPEALALRQHMKAKELASQVVTTTPTRASGWLGALQSVRAAWSSLTGWVRGTTTKALPPGKLRPPNPDPGDATPERLYEEKGKGLAKLKAVHERLKGTPDGEAAYLRLENALRQYGLGGRTKNSEIAKALHGLIHRLDGNVDVAIAILIPGLGYRSVVNLAQGLATTDHATTLAQQVLHTLRSQDRVTPKAADLLVHLLEGTESSVRAVELVAEHVVSVGATRGDGFTPVPGLAKVLVEASRLSPADMEAVLRQAGQAESDAPGGAAVFLTLRRATAGDEAMQQLLMGSDPRLRAHELQLISNALKQLTTPSERRALGQALKDMLEGVEASHRQTLLSHLDATGLSTAAKLRKLHGDLDVSAAETEFRKLMLEALGGENPSDWQSADKVTEHLKAELPKVEELVEQAGKRKLADYKRLGQERIDALEDGLQSYIERELATELEDVDAPQEAVAFIKAFIEAYPHAMHTRFSEDRTSLRQLLALSEFYTVESGTLTRKPVFDGAEFTEQTARKAAALLHKRAMKLLHSAEVQAMVKALGGTVNRPAESILVIAGALGLPVAVFLERSQKISEIRLNEDTHVHFGPIDAQDSKQVGVHTGVAREVPTGTEFRVAKEGAQPALHHVFNAFVRDVLAYDDVSRKVSELGLTDQQAATIMKEMLIEGPTGELARAKFAENEDLEGFFQTLMTLTLFRESARDPTTLLTSMMMLDTILKDTSGGTSFAFFLDQFKTVSTFGLKMKVRGHGGHLAPTMVGFQKVFRAMMREFQEKGELEHTLRELELDESTVHANDIADLVHRQYMMLLLWMKMRGVEVTEANIHAEIDKLVAEFHGHH